MSSVVEINMSSLGKIKSLSIEKVKSSYRRTPISSIENLLIFSKKDMLMPKEIFRGLL